MDKYFDASNHRLVCLGQPASPKLWDSRWETEDLGQFIRERKNSWIVHTTRRFLTPGSRLLEGGCGRGDKVYALQAAGYEAYGLDYAPRTVEAIKRSVPELTVCLGDLRQTPFPGKFFDGYWSLGVIEHFYGGYEAILSEMLRIIRPGGYLFLTFPEMSLLRKIKSAAGFYEPFVKSEDTLRFFYQFVVEAGSVVRQFQASGLQLVASRKLGGLEGLKEEVDCLRAAMEWVDGSPCLLARLAERIIDPLARPVANHTVLLVFRRS
jgi:SAM-dependent methyltransferase